MDRSTLPMAAIMMTLAALTSCQSANAPDAGASGGAAMTAPTAVPDVRPVANPAPRQRYALTLRFDGLPGALTDIAATADFEVENRECVPYDYSRAAGGVRLPPRYSVPLALQRIDDSTYIATLHEDALLDDDYYGLGVCRWALNTATVHFHSASTHFVGGIDAERLAAEAEVVDHYLARDFAQKPTPMDVVFGEESPDFYQSAAGPQFTLAIASRKEAP
ncbi:MAG: hypothetical protein ACOY82_17280 [Pseudomonadota bacterium]